MYNPSGPLTSISGDSATPPGAVPAPPAVVLGLLGVGGMFLGRVRRKTAAATA